jgi:hypothetical protein
LEDTLTVNNHLKVVVTGVFFVYITCSIRTEIRLIAMEALSKAEFDISFSSRKLEKAFNQKNEFSFKEG